MSWRNASNNEKHKVQSTFFRLAVEKQVLKFLDSEESELKFPATLNREERNFIGNYATEKLGLHSKITGKGAQTQIVVFKSSDDMQAAASSTIELQTSSKNVILKVVEVMGVESGAHANVEKVEQNLQAELVAIGSQSHPSHGGLTIPPNSVNAECIEIRQALPIYESRDPLLTLIRTNQVLIVESSTGSGKSTQIPQFILEDCSEKKIPCRIIVAQPRRICATSLAERVSFERGEDVGTTVGYQIRLQSKVSPTSNCIYVTNGVILRMLMTGKPEEFFNSITHLIIDEVHERDKFSDFLMLCVREYLPVNPKLRIIIMSATIESNVFQEYFGCSSVVKLEGACHEVQEFFLEDMLKILRFSNGRVDDLNQMYRKNPELINKPAKQSDTGRRIKEELREAADEILDKIASSPDCNNSFVELTYSVKADGLPVNFRHSKTKKTALMFAVEYGLTEHIEKLLNLKADPMMRIDAHGDASNSLDLAVKMNNPEVVRILVNYLELLNGPKPTEESVVETSPYDRMLLEIYYDTLVQPGVHRGTFLEDVVDLQIAKRIIIDLHFNTNKAYGILVFLPGHDEIVQLANLLTNSLDMNYTLFILHSQMQTVDQVSVFDKSPPGVRKIILATNIAESSITVNDVVFVIDSGKEKQKEFNPITHVSSLRAQWISKASAKQRKGRAGRTSGGFCYRLYSRDRYNFLVDNPKPEFLRCEMTDLCLQSKMIGKSGQSVARFLQKAISPPTDQTIAHSLKMLRDLGALNDDESFTQLGLYLADLPMNAKYGKMLIYGIFFKCLDPVLTIVSILSVNDPFALLYTQEERDLCHQLKRKVEDRSFSDHFVFLRIYQLWNEYQSKNEFDGGFCEDNFVNSATMHRIASLRIKIIGYLRSVRLINIVGNLSTLNQYSHNWSIVKACLAAGSYPEIARIDKRLARISTSVDPKVVINPGSILRPATRTKQTREIIESYPSDWLIFEEKNLAGVIPMTKTCTLISSTALILTAGRRITINDNSCIAEKDDNTVEMQIDEFVKFTATPEVAYGLKEVRDKFNALLVKFLRSPEKFVFKDSDEMLIESVVKVLEIEDEKTGFKIVHSGIGARPRIITQYAAQTNGHSIGHREDVRSDDRRMKTKNHEQTKVPEKIREARSGEKKVPNAFEPQRVVERKSAPAIQEIVRSPEVQMVAMQETPKADPHQLQHKLTQYATQTNSTSIGHREDVRSDDRRIKTKNHEQTKVPEKIGEARSGEKKIPTAFEPQRVLERELTPAIQEIARSPEVQMIAVQETPEAEPQQLQETPKEINELKVQTTQLPEILDVQTTVSSLEGRPTQSPKIPKVLFTLVEDPEQENELDETEVAEIPIKNENTKTAEEPKQPNEEKIQEIPVKEATLQVQEPKQPEQVNTQLQFRHIGNNRFFLAELKSPELAKKLASKKYALLEKDAELSEGFLDGFLEAEVNDKCTQKRIVFFCEKEVVGVAMLEPYAEAKVSRDRLKMYFSCDKTFPINKLKPLIGNKIFRETIKKPCAEISQEVGAFCLDMCLEQPDEQ